MIMEIKYLNPGLLVIILFMEIILNQTLSSQELRHQRKSLGSRMTEECDVLKSKNDFKEGQYILKIDNFICQIGSYKNNQRSGPWKVYYSKDELEFEYNYDTNELTYLNKKYYLSKDDTTLLRPIFLGGMKYFFQSVINNIDPKQMQWGDGSLSVSFEVDPNGLPQKFMITSSSNYRNLDLLALEAVKTVATSSFKFLPAKKDKKPTSFILDVPIDYTVRSAF
jgi:TonB family protein